MPGGALYCFSHQELSPSLLVVRQELTVAGSLCCIGEADGMDTPSPGGLHRLGDVTAGWHIGTQHLLEAGPDREGLCLVLSHQPLHSSAMGVCGQAQFNSCVIPVLSGPSLSHLHM